MTLARALQARRTSRETRLHLLRSRFPAVSCRTAFGVWRSTKRWYRSLGYGCVGQCLKRHVCPGTILLLLFLCLWRYNRVTGPLCGLYFLLTWKDLYSYDHHYFLLSNKVIILKNIMYTTLFIPLCVILFLTFNPVLLKDPLLERYIFISLILLMCDIVSFIMINLIASGWISHLVKAGYLKKNIMIIGKEKNYPELDTIFPYNQISKNPG